MSGAKMLILCTLGFLIRTSEALSAKDTKAAAPPAPAPVKTLHQEHHEAKQELKKLLDGKSPAEIVALSKQVGATGATGVVGKVASAAASTAVAAVSKTVSALAGASWGECPDGFASQSSVNGCCTSQALRHMKQAKLLCEATVGWKTTESSGSFTCCPPVKVAAVAPPTSSPGKEKEVTELKKQVADLKALLQKDSKAKEAKAAKDTKAKDTKVKKNIGHAPSPPLGKVHSEVNGKAKAMAQMKLLEREGYGQNQQDCDHCDPFDPRNDPLMTPFGPDGHGGIMEEIVIGGPNGKNVLPPEIDREIGQVMAALEPHPLSQGHHNTYIMPSHLSQKQANDAFAQAIDDDIMVGLGDALRPNRGAKHHSAGNDWSFTQMRDSAQESSGWDKSHFVILGVIFLLAYW